MTNNRTTIIRADGIYRDPESKPHTASDPPQGCVMARRYYSGGRQYKIGDPWPNLAIGEEIEVQTTDHYIWHGVVEEIRDEDTVAFRPSGPKVAMPLPPVVEGQPYRLPWVSGDAWSRRPEAGTILLIEDQPYRVVGKPRPVRGSTDYVFVLRAIGTDAYATRPGRTSIKDLTDPNPSIYCYEHNIGRVIQIGAEWLRIEKVSRVAYTDGEGTQIGYNTICTGHFVGDAEAAKLGQKWAAKEKVRRLAHDLKVAAQDVDYGGRPEAIPALEAALEAAKKDEAALEAAKKEVRR